MGCEKSIGVERSRRHEAKVTSDFTWWLILESEHDAGFCDAFQEEGCLSYQLAWLWEPAVDQPGRDIVRCGSVYSCAASERFYRVRLRIHHRADGALGCESCHVLRPPSCVSALS